MSLSARQDVSKASRADPRSSFASVDLGAVVLDRLGPSRLLIRDGRRELLGRMWREGLHTELEEQLLEFPGRLNFLELVGETHEDIQWGPRRRDDSLPCLPIVARNRGGNRRHACKQGRRL